MRGFWRGLQQYKSVRHVYIDNPNLWITDLLRYLADPRLEQLNAILKKEVLLVVRDLVHHLYVKNQREQQALTPELQTWKNGRRVYYAEIPERQILLLLGGNKNGQDKDIRQAKKIFNKHVSSGEEN